MVRCAGAAGTTGVVGAVGVVITSDGAEVADWAKPYVSALAARGYINGDETGNLYPQAYITREEFAQIMHNIISGIPYFFQILC